MLVPRKGPQRVGDTQASMKRDLVSRGYDDTDLKGSDSLSAAWNV
jgi:hypothetical protein